MLKKILYFFKTAETLLYIDSLGLLRLALVILLILISADLCVLTFETPEKLINVFLQIGRYSLVPLGVLLLIFLLGAEFIQDLYNLDHYSSAVKHLCASMFQLFLPALKVVNDVEQLNDDNLLVCVGGPGRLNIEHGNVVVLERLESPSSVLGAGRHSVGRFNRIKNVVSLIDQDVQPEKAIVATTKDGIVVEVHNLQIRCRIYTGHKDGSAKRTLKNPYPYSVQAVRNMTYDVIVGADGKSGKWQNSVLNAVVGALTSFINAHLLDRVIYPRFEENDSRSEIAKKIESAEMRAKLKSTGGELIWYDLGEFQVAEEIEERRREARFANLWGMATVIRAQGEAERIANQERGRAEGQVNLLSGIIQALSESDVSDKTDENLWNIVLARTAQVIESMTTIYESAEYSEEDKNDNQS
jgi:hypothetical protein